MGDAKNSFDFYKITTAMHHPFGLLIRREVPNDVNDRIESTGSELNGLVPKKANELRAPKP